MKCVGCMFFCVISYCVSVVYNVLIMMLVSVIVSGV